MFGSKGYRSCVNSDLVDCFSEGSFSLNTDTRDSTINESTNFIPSLSELALHVLTEHSLTLAVGLEITGLKKPISSTMLHTTEDEDHQETSKGNADGGVIKGEKSDDGLRQQVKIVMAALKTVTASIETLTMQLDGITSRIKILEAKDRHDSSCSPYIQELRHEITCVKAYSDQAITIATNLQRQMTCGLTTFLESAEALTNKKRKLN